MNETDLSRPIFLVEDNPMDLDLTLRAFSRHKLVNQFNIARDGEEALAYVTNWDPTQPLPVVILLDLKLPKVDGLEVLHVIKNHPVFQQVPVVVLTTSTEDRDIERAYRLGANSYIVKPVNFEKFIEVARHIEIYWTILNHPPLPTS
jgi:CheY-like chemotaxis protein